MKSLKDATALGYAGGVRVRELFCKSKMLAVTIALLAISPFGRAQIQATSLSSAIELARADMRAQRNELITAGSVVNRCSPVWLEAR